MNGVTEVKGKGTTDLQSRMDSRINLGRGFPIQENDFQFVGSSWMPANPQKPIPTRSNFTMAERQGGQFGRVDLPGWDGVRGGFPQMLTLNEALYYNQMGRNGTNCMGDTSLFTRIRAMAPIAGPNSDTMYDVTGMSPNMVAQTAYANTMLGRNMSMAREITMPNLHSQVSTQRESEFSQIHCSSSRLLDRFNSPSQTNLYEYPVPYHTCYDMNSLPREADAAFSATISSQFTPVTPHQGKILESMPSAMVNLPTITCTNEEKDKTEDVFLHREQNTSHTNSELLHAVLDSSSAVTSTALMEPANPDGGSDQVIDLNKTPEQKPPRRKKHRPKVIVEGKPKTTPKSSTPVKTNSEEKPPGKRKYVRKSLQESPTKNTESVEEAVNPRTGKRAYARIESLDESAIQHEDSSWGTISPSTSAGKWKYVQKKSLEESAIQLEDSTGKTTEFNAGKNFECQEGLEQAAMQHGDANRETAYCSPGTAQKSCRRTLNFESENTRGLQNLGAAQQQEHPKESLNLNVGFESPELCSDADKLYNTKSVSQVKQQNWSPLENQHSVSMSNLIKFMNQMQGDCTPIPDTQITSAKLDSLNATRKNLNCSTISRNRETAQQVQTAVSETFFPAKSNCRSYERARQMTSQLNPQSEAKMPSFLLEARGLQTELYHSEQRRLCSPKPTCPSLLRQERIHVEGYNRNGNISSATCLETHKRRKMYDGTRADSFEMLSSFEIDKVSRPGSNCTRSLDATAFMFRTNYDKSSQFRSGSDENRGHGGSNSLVGNLSLPMMASGHYLPQQHNPLQPDAWRERMERANRSSQVNNLVLLPLTKNCTMPPPTDPRSGPAPEKRQQPNIANYKTSGEFQTMGSSTLAISMQSEKVSMRQPQKDVLEDHQQSSAKQRGRLSKQKLADQIEEVICRLEGLSINNQQNALVPYRGGDGTIIPYAGSQLKKHKPRPKVDLDPETDRVWKLLMGKEGSEGVEASDKEKEQWWQNEREVFRLRVDSFIARMHLVQGDRRFSKWKGSVVDSVIGVFLTQNVSDHLSSSAFMSLASLFPPKSRENRACHREKRSVVVQEPDDCIVNPTDTIKNREDLSFSVYNRSSMTNPTPTSMFEREFHCMDEEVISSQDSVDSVIIQANEGVMSYSGLNSEAEDPASVCRPRKIQNFSYTDLLMSTAHFDEYSSPISGGLLFQEGSGDGLEKPKVDNANHRSNFTSFKSMDYPYVLNHQINHNNANMKVSIAPSSAYMSQPTTEPIVQEAVLRFHGEESTCSWPSTASAFIKERQASCTTKVGQRVEGAGNTAAEQYRSPRFQKIPIMDLHQKPICERSTSSPYRSQSHECRNELQLDSTQALKPVNHNEAVVTTQNTHRQPTPRNTGNIFDKEESINSVDEITRFNYKLVAQNSKEQVHSTDMKHIEGSAKTLKARKGKAECEKKDATDWDSLRRQVPENRRKERSEATMDSLDYEALRSASVKEISDAIKERGMNNMLAERIKEFLDRVVSEHGSTDLEWLRDVPPDKAKEYLLSVRGLGLKSVECVRLLTLHHLAFPVDTNVGRIAVRLGWVPLQPLPESLQLHLLELYPILETIQKYLWPRLCKLDQRTLYELHYQMITFGKVFCTKSRPNCNACPMRAECRHFASAFASARLALPGPEDKSITISAAPFFTGRIPGVVINSLSLPPPEDKPLTRSGSYISKCVPIVEEPATPEQNHYEVTESDIEDAFYEDPDEIPTIELNIEKFTRNLQDYMQGSMDIKEADLSKALVVLNQNAASIPQPKLKNISRLRTEHQVYELPDSHPLLKGMDKREPDDPSPYLLAIWAPGETANSINAPEQLCQSQESGKLCHDNTCFSCNGVREASSRTVRGTILIPCRTAMRGSFPLNGTYFQVNEVFADHESSLNPISVPRQWIWNLPRRMVFFGTSVSTIFKGLSTEEIQFCFWKAFVCVRGFDQETRAPRPLKARLHFPISKLTKTKNQKT